VSPEISAAPPKVILVPFLSTIGVGDRFTLFTLTGALLSSFRMNKKGYSESYSNHLCLRHSIVTVATFLHAKRFDPKTAQNRQLKKIVGVLFEFLVFRYVNIRAKSV
jgi:hypothetical protein